MLKLNGRLSKKKIAAVMRSRSVRQIRRAVAALSHQISDHRFLEIFNELTKRELDEGLSCIDGESVAEFLDMEVWEETTGEYEEALKELIARAGGSLPAQEWVTDAEVRAVAKKLGLRVRVDDDSVRIFGLGRGLGIKGEFSGLLDRHRRGLLGPMDPWIRLYVNYEYPYLRGWHMIHIHQSNIRNSTELENNLARAKLACCLASRPRHYGYPGKPRAPHVMTTHSTR